MTAVLSLITTALLIGGAVTLIAGIETPSTEALDQIGDAQQAGERAGELTERITSSLEALAHNLGAGRDLDEQSGEIEELTARQRASLEDLVVILERQLEALEASTEDLGAAESSTRRVAALSRRQARLVERAVHALEQLRDSAAAAGSFSAEVTRRARYAARLAEDSADAFGGR